MSIFGPRENDPLLQDDPLAPSSKQEPAPQEDASSPPASENEASATSRLLLRSMADAQNGKLDTLNRALANGWTLERVELQPEETMAIVLRRPSNKTDAKEKRTRSRPSDQEKGTSEAENDFPPR